jgi:hypothetical protein
MLMLNGAEQSLVALEAKTEQHAEALYAPPRLDRADVVGGLLDQEIRNHARSLNEKGRAELGRSLQEGGRFDALAAILRSPVPLHSALSDAAQAGWHAHIERVNPEGVATVTLGREANEWARRALAQARSKLR